MRSFRYEEFGDGYTAYVRLAVVGSGVAVLMASMWFAASWIDAGYDSTCGSVLRPTEWNNAPECHPVMLFRLVVAVGAAVAGGLIVLSGFGSRWTTHTVRLDRFVALAAGAMAFATVLVVLNEFVRSGGLWDH